MAFETFEKGAETVHERELASLLKAVVQRGEGLKPVQDLLDAAVGPGVGMVLASAEESGRLDTASIRLAEMMRRYAGHRKAVLFSVFQICFALTVAVVVPSPFQFLARYIAGVALVLGLLLRLERQRDVGIAQLVWKIPLLGKSVQGPAIIRIFTVLGLGVDSGRSLVVLLNECAAGEANSAAARACDRASRSLSAGATLTECLSENLVLTDVEIARLQQGEHLGRVPKALHGIAEARLQGLGKTLRRTGVALIVLPYILFVVPFVVLIFVFAQDLPSP